MKVDSMEKTQHYFGMMEFVMKFQSDCFVCYAGLKVLLPKA